MDRTSRTINVERYLQVMEQMPGVSLGDVEGIKKALLDVYEKLPTTITFERGLKKGDGDIVTYQEATTYNGRDYSTILHFLQDGTLENREININAQLPKSVARYFFGGIFGSDELNYAKYDEAPSPEHVNEAISGAMALYDCLTRNKSLEKCQNSGVLSTIRATVLKIDEDNRVADTNRETIIRIRPEIARYERVYQTLKKYLSKNADVQITLLELKAKLPSSPKTVKDYENKFTILEQMVNLAYAQFVKDYEDKKNENLKDDTYKYEMETQVLMARIGLYKDNNFFKSALVEGMRCIPTKTSIEDRYSAAVNKYFMAKKVLEMEREHPKHCMMYKTVSVEKTGKWGSTVWGTKRECESWSGTDYGKTSVLGAIKPFCDSKCEIPGSPPPLNEFLENKPTLVKKIEEVWRPSPEEIEEK